MWGHVGMEQLLRVFFPPFFLPLKNNSGQACGTTATLEMRLEEREKIFLCPGDIGQAVWVGVNLTYSVAMLPLSLGELTVFLSSPIFHIVAENTYQLEQTLKLSVGTGKIAPPKLELLVLS